MASQTHLLANSPGVWPTGLQITLFTSSSPKPYQQWIWRKRRSKWNINGCFTSSDNRERQEDNWEERQIIKLAVDLLCLPTVQPCLNGRYAIRNESHIFFQLPQPSHQGLQSGEILRGAPSLPHTLVLYSWKHLVPMRNHLQQPLQVQVHFWEPAIIQHPFLCGTHTYWQQQQAFKMWEPQTPQAQVQDLMILVKTIYIDHTDNQPRVSFLSMWDHLLLYRQKLVTLSISRACKF